MLRVIGCGNTDRADDGAGILVARRLRELGLDALEHAGDGFALLELWHGSDDVVLVDAMSSGALPGTVSVWDASVPASSSSYCCSTHVFGPADAIELGRALDRLPLRIRVYGIEAARFDPGAAPSSEVLAAVDRVIHELADVAQSPTGAAITGVVVG
jgi:hydrogenase maturation protease